MRKAYKFRLRPNAKQCAALETTLGLCRRLYNAGLEEKRDAFGRQRLSLNCSKQQSELSELKLVCPEYTVVYAQVLQDVLKRLHRAFDGFFRRVKAGQTPGYPRFKSKDRYDSFTFPQVSRPLKGLVLAHGGVERLANRRLRVHGVPGELKVIWHREMQGVPKTATFRREGKHWYVIFSCDDLPLEAREATGKSVGVDVGIEAFATFDDGTRVENPRLLANAWERVLKAQRIVSRRKLRSKRRAKARAILAAAHRRVANARRDFHHKTARMLVRSYDRIAVEDLNVRGLVRGMLRKQVADVGWGQFFSILRSKAEGAGCEVREVTAAGTSQECAACGAEAPKSLSKRTHRCSLCGFTTHRDHNSALVIRHRAFGNGPGSGPRRDADRSVVEARTGQPGFTSG